MVGAIGSGGVRLEERIESWGRLYMLECTLANERMLAAGVPPGAYLQTFLQSWEPRHYNEEMLPFIHAPIRLYDRQQI